MLDRLFDIYQQQLDRVWRNLTDEGKAHCSRCEAENIEPNVYAYQVSGEIVCDECAEEVFEENSQFGVGA